MDEQPTAADPRLARLADRVEITEVLARYCRGVDRCDLETLTAVYHPDAIDDHGTFTGNADEFARWATRGAATSWQASHHTVHNVVIDWIDADTAAVECSVLGINQRRPAPPEARNPGVERVELFAGRYLDRFERREGVWRIAHRRAIRDVDTLLDRRRWAGAIPAGGRFPDDPLYGPPA